MEYHVLNNFEIEMILSLGAFSFPIIWFLFSYLAYRDASTNQPKKSLLEKIAPWLVLCVLLSEIFLFIYRFVDYPWNIEPQPSQASIFRENQYHSSGYPAWGWANDYQLALLSSLSHCLLWFGWTIYAFDFSHSDSNWWKKIIKVVAYVILSAVIVSFSIHEYRDLLFYLALIAVVVILLLIAQVKRAKPVQEDAIEELISTETIPDKNKTIPTEDPSRFMPKQKETEPISKDYINKDSDLTLSVKKDEIQQLENEKPIETICENENKNNYNEDVPQQIICNKNEFCKIEMMYCKHCGKRIEVDSKFCKYCGKRL